MSKKIILAIFFVISIQFFGLLIPVAQANQYRPQVEINTAQGGISEKRPLTINGSAIGNYISTIYSYMIGSIGIVATVVMMYGGILWILAAGSPEKISRARSYVFSAMSGLVLALFSYTILSMISPDLVKLTPLKVGNVAEKDIDLTTGCCLWPGGGEPTSSDREYCENGTDVKGTYFPDQYPGLTKCMTYRELGETCSDTLKCRPNLLCTDTGGLGPSELRCIK